MTEETKDQSEMTDTSAGEPVRVVLDPASFSFQSVGRVVVITLILLFIAGFVQSVFTSLTYLFFLVVVSVFFAYLIDPLVKLIRRPFKARKIERFMPRSLAILVSYIVVFTAVSLGIASLAPRVVEQAKDFITNLPTYGASIQRTANDLSRRFDRLRLPEQLETKVNEKVVEGIDSVTTFITSVILGGVFVSLITYAPWLVLVPILAFFFLKDVNLFRLAVLRLFPAGRLRMRAESVMQDVNTTLAAYTRAQLISCFIIGVICTIGFYFIGLKYPLLLGILAGIFEFVPLLGPALIGLIVITTS
ncbi:MAG: AI-2E family transporter, partial [Blastocatellia bacterium]